MKGRLIREGHCRIAGLCVLGSGLARGQSRLRGWQFIDDQGLSGHVMVPKGTL